MKYGNKQARGAIVKEPPFNKPEYPCDKLPQFRSFQNDCRVVCVAADSSKTCVSLLVCLCFMVVEFCGGYFTHRQEKIAYDLLHIAQFLWTLTVYMFAALL